MKLSGISDLTKEDVLGGVGLAFKTTTTERLIFAFGVFGVGVVVGAATALLFAPKSGRGLREDIADRLHPGRDGVEAPEAASASDDARA